MLALGRAAVAAALILAAVPAFAQHNAAPRTITFDLSKAIADARSILSRVEQGMELADQIAKANTLPELVAPNQIASQCYEAVDGFAKSLDGQLATIPQDISTDPLVMAPVIFQLNRSLVKQVINGVPTPLRAGCAGLALDVGQDVGKLMITLVGAAAMKTFAAGIGIPPIPAIP